MKNFVCKIDKKMYLDGLILPIKKSQWLYYKIKTPSVSLQMTQTPRVIIKFSLYLFIQLMTFQASH